jgi:hypothetical protein
MQMPVNQAGGNEQSSGVDDAGARATASGRQFADRGDAAADDCHVGAQNLPGMDAQNLAASDNDIRRLAA